MKLYSYSSELLTFVESKWVIAKFATCGILMGIVILFGAIKMNQSVGSVIGSRSTNTLTSDNNFLRQQISLISARTNKLEMQVKQLNERANTLHMFLSRRKIVEDSVASLTNLAKVEKLHPLIFAAQSLHH